VLSASEIARGTQGALGFLRLDRAAPLHFDNTMSVCLRSFRVMILVAPLQAVLLLLRYSNLTYAVDDLELVLVEALHYVVDWLLFPVIFYEVARCAAGSTVIRATSAPQLGEPAGHDHRPDRAVDRVGDADRRRDSMRLGLQLFILYWIVATTRMTLEANWPVSVMLMVLIWLPSELLSLVVDRFLGVAAIAT